MPKITTSAGGLKGGAPRFGADAGIILHNKKNGANTRVCHQATTMVKQEKLQTFMHNPENGSRSPLRESR